MLRTRILKLLTVVVVFLSVNGCRTTGNIGQMEVYLIPPLEAEWIRKGEPISFENELWYPADGVEILLDSEVSRLGEYQGVQFFIEKLDVRPYKRLYTKFGHNQFRYFEKRLGND